jgi:hypothetical protein
LPQNNAVGSLERSAVVTDNPFPGNTVSSAPNVPVLHGEALARSPFLERAGGWIVLSFTGAFTLFPLLMRNTGQVPGESFLLKSVSDCLQFTGECIGLYFSLVITFRLDKAATQLSRRLRQLLAERGRENNEIVTLRNEAQSACQSFWAWMSLSIPIAVYASGQAIWTSYDVRMQEYTPDGQPHWQGESSGSRAVRTAHQGRNLRQSE